MSTLSSIRESQTDLEIHYRTQRTSLIDQCLPQSPVNISPLIESYLEFNTVPFQAAFLFLPEDKPLFDRQFIAFFHHCQLFSSSDGEKCLKGRKTDVYTLDLVMHNLVWREQNALLRIRKVVVETWIESERILFSGLSECVTSYAQKWIFELDRNTRSEESVYYLTGDKTIDPSKIPYIFLNGNEFEHHTLPKQCTIQDQLLANKTWDHWKEERGSAIKDTRSVIFPLFEEAMKYICSVFSEPSVLDVGGCDGDLGYFLLERCQEIGSFTLLDKSKELVNLADTRSKCNCPFLSDKRTKLKAIPGDLRNVEIFEVTGKQHDAIILCGVIAEHVLSRNDSLKLVENCKRSLKDRGFMLVAAYSNHHLNADDYRNLGLRVLNKSFSFMEDGKSVSIQFYILQIEPNKTQVN
jgi:SAM-dependent methyltransferase